MKKQYLLSLIFLLVSISAFAKDQAHGFKVSWPETWDVTSPPQKNGSYLVVAKKVVKGVPKAAISLHELPRKDEGKVDLKHEFDVMLETSKIAFIHNGYKVKMTDVSPITFKGKNAFTSTLLLSHPAQMLTQKVTMFLSDKYIYSFAIIKVGNVLSSETKEEIADTTKKLQIF